MKKYRSKYFYTLVELLMAMAIFAIISVIMMRFFNSAQQIWSKASQKNVLYSDARVALDIMTAELQSALYDNKVGDIADSNKTPGIYPFWFEYKTLDDASSTEPLFGSPQYNYTGSAVQQATYNKSYVTQLNFISATPYKTHTNASNICEVKYIYLPVRLDNADKDNPTGIWNVLDNASTPAAYPIKGGVLARACTGNLKSDGTSNFDASNTDCLYNFLLLPHDPAVVANRVKDIFRKRSSEKYLPVIDGIVDMKITCYTLQLASGYFELKSYNPMYNNGRCVVNGGSINLGASPPTDSTLDNEDITTDLGTIVSGNPFPVAVKIDLYVLAERDMREWLEALNNARPKQANKIKNERMRCFSKIIYLGGGK